MVNGAFAINRVRYLELRRPDFRHRRVHAIGPGATMLTSNDSYSGATTVSAGRPVVSGSIVNTAVTSTAAPCSPAPAR